MGTTIKKPAAFSKRIEFREWRELLENLGEIGEQVPVCLRRGCSRSVHRMHPWENCHRFLVAIAKGKRMTARPINRLRLLISAVSLMLFAPGVAEAHVKWFCGPIDGSLPPRPFRDVLTPLFVELLIFFAVVVAVGAMLDALIERMVSTPIISEDRSKVLCDVIVRLGLATYALCLWRNLALVLWADTSNSSILTPDLYGTAGFVGYLQLTIAVAVLIPRLSLIAAGGLMLLYMMGVAKFGLFYMIDYLFFPGLAAYIALGDPLVSLYPWLQRLRVSILIGSLGLSLMWTAVEKFLFPQWTISVLLIHPGVTAGFSFDTVATIAGFVEFSLAFYLLVGREILGRVGAVLLAIVFIAAMPEFGMLDIIGHIPVVVILLVTLLTGETPLQVLCRGNHVDIIRSGWTVSRLYILILIALIGLYYGLHALSVLI